MTDPWRVDVPGAEATTAPERVCLDCGYDLRGLPAGSCPECGRRFDPDDPGTWGGADSPWTEVTRWGRRGLLAGGVSLLGCCVGGWMLYGLVFGLSVSTGLLGKRRPAWTWWGRGAVVAVPGLLWLGLALGLTLADDEFGVPDPVVAGLLVAGFTLVVAATTVTLYLSAGLEWNDARAACRRPTVRAAALASAVLLVPVALASLGEIGEIAAGVTIVGAVPSLLLLGPMYLAREMAATLLVRHPRAKPDAASRWRPDSSEPVEAAPRCLDCDYDLRGLSAGPCPECGLTFDPADPTTWRDPLELEPASRCLGRRGFEAGVVTLLTSIFCGMGIVLPGLIFGVHIVDPLVRERRPDASRWMRVRGVLVPALGYVAVWGSIPAIAWPLAWGWRRLSDGDLEMMFEAMVILGTLTTGLIAAAAGWWTTTNTLRTIGVPREIVRRAGIGPAMVGGLLAATATAVIGSKILGGAGAGVGGALLFGPVVGAAVLPWLLARYFASVLDRRGAAGAASP